MRIPSLPGGLALSLLVASPLVAGAPSTVTFVIDMREEIAAKRFDTAKDAVGVRGGVAPLSWNETLPARDDDGDGRYEVRVTFPERPFGGQNLFDASDMGMEWQMDEIAERLISSGRIEPVIIVAVFNTEARRDEYTPTTVEWKRPDGVVLRGGGKADLYGRLLVEELKPFIDRTYRTRPEPRSTGLGGASHGGLVSLYVGLKHPEVFGGLLVVSPSVPWDDHAILKTVAALPAKTAQHIWVDMGDREGEEMLAGARRLRDALVAKGWKPGADLHYWEQERGGHDEISWASRVEPMLRFLYGKE